MARIAVLPILLLIVILIISLAVIALLVYFFAYKKHINKTLHEDVKVKRHFPSLGAVAAVIGIATLIFFMITISTEIGQLHNELDSLNSYIFSLRSELSSVYDSLEEWRKDENSLITSANWDYGEYDLETQSAEIIVTVIPKTFTNETQMSIHIGNDTFSLSNDGNGIFRGTCLVNIFDDYGDTAILTISAGNEQRTEVLEDIGFGKLHYFYLPNLEANFDCYKSDYSKGSLLLKGSLRANCINPSFEGSGKITDVHMIIESNGNIIEDNDISDQILFDDSYVKTLSAKIDQSYKISKSDRFDIFVLAHDTHNYSYKQHLYTWCNGEDTWYDDDCQIFDDSGVLLNGK